MLHITNVSKSYNSGKGSTPILHEVNYQLSASQSLAITGPSGSGKSTLLHIIGALTKPTSGEIEISVDGRCYRVHSLTESKADAFRRDELGMVFQKFNLIDFLTVQDNIELTAKHKGNFDAAYVATLIERLEIAVLANKYPPNLSGGEQQRVAIARALAHKPGLLLADEPTGNLDPKTSEAVAQLLFDVCHQQAVMLIVVTHSSELASLANYRMQVKDGQLIKPSV